MTNLEGFLNKGLEGLNISGQRKEKPEGLHNHFTPNQSWGALKKAWTGYRIAKVQNDLPRMVEYANKIRKIQGELGISVCTFPNLGID